jgi:hercynylcysteine S-oxide lyase
VFQRVITVEGGTQEVAWPLEELAEIWRTARSSHPAGYLNAAACNVPSDRVLASVVGQLERERALGGYAAAEAIGPVLQAGRSALASYVGAAPDDVGFLENGTVAFATVLAGWGLPADARVGVVRSEFGSNKLLLDRLAQQRGWSLIELPADDHGRILLDGLDDALSAGLDLVTFPHIASHRGIAQPAQQAGQLCHSADVPLILDVCQSLGHIDVSGIGAAAYTGTSRKWLAGPRGAGFVIVPGLAEGRGPDAAAPTFQTHAWSAVGGLPMAGARRYEQDDACYAARAGLAAAVQEHKSLGSASIYARLAEIGPAARRLLDGSGGWHANEPIDEPTAIITLLPPGHADPAFALAEAARAAKAAGLQIGVITRARAPYDLSAPVLRVSLSVGAYQRDIYRLSEVLASMGTEQPVRHGARLPHAG